MNWAADSLHCVVFFQPTTSRPDALQPWIKIFGEAPQNYQAAPVGAPPGGQAGGRIGDYQITIIAMPGRIELVLAPLGDNGPPAPIASIETAVATATEYFKILLDDHNPVRVGFVANLSKHFPSLSAAVSSFKGDTKLAHLPADASDLNFAINVRRKIDSVDLTINRLCRWATGIRQILTLEMLSGGINPHTSMEETIVETLQIDLNTVAQEREIPSGNVDILLKELISEFKIIVSQGYDRLALYK